MAAPAKLSIPHRALETAYNQFSLMKRYGEVHWQKLKLLDITMFGSILSATEALLAPDE
jgi:hypothetical protein